MRLEVTLDCVDLDAAASFWGAALGCGVEHSVEGRYAAVTCGGLTVNLQAVTEPKAGKNRAHLDLLVGDLAGELTRLESLGARRREAHEEFGQTWYVLEDPEGNEFCLAQGPD
jgi:catechol 2,3-dioxygenase-like lactoylglutathione lyase family enzyme